MLLALLWVFKLQPNFNRASFLSCKMELTTPAPQSVGITEKVSHVHGAHVPPTGKCMATVVIVVTSFLSASRPMSATFSQPEHGRRKAHPQNQVPGFISDVTGGYASS